jgi:uroporphyrinogen III methyltransferase/synthase
LENSSDLRLGSGKGKVYLVGAGPGDPWLLTRKGEAALKLADVVVYDHLASPSLLDLAPSGAVRILAGKSIGHCILKQDEINELLLDHARAGRNVVRLKGGDPLIFGRGGEEAAFLRAAGVPFEIVPGVTAGVGVSAYAGVSITHRSHASAVAFVTGHDDPESETNSLDWRALAAFPGTLVIYMGVTHLAAICRALVRFGKSPDTPAATVESGTLPSQRTVVGTLATIATIAAAAGLHPPALLIVGSVIEERDQLHWFESLPLFGQRIVITRPRAEALPSSAMLEMMGAEVIVAPTIAVRPLADSSRLDRSIDRLAEYDWLVFTSANGVRFFMQRLFERGQDLRVLGHLRFAAIGPITAKALALYHLNADLVPESFRSEALAEALAQVAAGRKILLARADRGRTLLKDELEPLADVDQVAVYHNEDVESLADEIVARILEGTVDWITLTSSAITERLHALLPEAARSRVGHEIRLASLSPVTSATASGLGWKVSAEATEFTWEGLVQAIARETTMGRREH